MIAARLSNGKLGHNQYSEGLPVGKASAILNVSERSVARAKEIMKSGVVEVVAPVEAGPLRVLGRGRDLTHES